MPLLVNPNNITKRSDVNRPLTYGEIDANFNEVALVAQEQIDTVQIKIDAENARDAALTSETNAATSAANALVSENNAATSESNADTSESNALTSENNAATTYINFDKRYLGQKSSAPTLDNQGAALVTGALYFNTTVGDMYVYNGTVWVTVSNTTSSDAANTSAINAATSESNALTYFNNTASIYDQFDERYLGQKASAPTLDNNGVALLVGALYFNTTTNDMNVYTGLEWVTVSNTASSDSAANSATEAAISADEAEAAASVAVAAAGIDPSDFVPQTSVNGAAVIPKGTIAQRPANPIEGMFRRNTETGDFEGYDGTSWGIIGGGSIDDITGLQDALDDKEPTFTKATGFNKPFGTTANTVTEGNDVRLSDARTPIAHDHDDLYHTKAYIDGELGDISAVLDGILGV